LDRVALEGRRPLPALPLARAEAGIAAGIRRTAETDLVPGPRVRVERAQDRAHQHAPCPFGIEVVPPLAPQLTPVEGVDDLVLDLVGGAREIGTTVLPRHRVEALRRPSPGLAIVGHPCEAEAVELAGE